ncbi:MAG TPA: hypothetical protein VJQ55_00655 [Candidatus Binatia bacterium]|nr:hypothetical protein [Candidatus Binatia bacterium]
MEKRICRGKIVGRIDLFNSLSAFFAFRQLELVLLPPERRAAERPFIGCFEAACGLIRAGGRGFRRPVSVLVMGRRVRAWLEREAKLRIAPPRGRWFFFWSDLYRTDILRIVGAQLEGVFAARAAKSRGTALEKVVGNFVGRLALRAANQHGPSLVNRS